MKILSRVCNVAALLIEYIWLVAISNVLAYNFSQNSSVSTLVEGPPVSSVPEFVYLISTNVMLENKAIKLYAFYFLLACA